MDRRQFLASAITVSTAALATSGNAVSQMLSAQPPTGLERVVRLAAKPSQIDVDLTKTAVIVVDMQNDFCSKGGVLDHRGVDLAIVSRVIAPIRNVLAVARQSALKIVYLKMGFQPDLSDIGPRGSRSWINNAEEVGKPVTAPSGVQSRILIRDTWNTDIVSELKPQAGETVIYKNRFSGFYQTNLDTTLKNWGIRFLIMTGCTTSVCVESTLRDAYFRDYCSVLLADCTAEPEGFGMLRTNYEATLLLVEDIFGWVSSSDKFVEALKEMRPSA